MHTVLRPAFFQARRVPVSEDKRTRIQLVDSRRVPCRRVLECAAVLCLSKALAIQQRLAEVRIGNAVRRRQRRQAAQIRMVGVCKIQQQPWQSQTAVVNGLIQSFLEPIGLRLHRVEQVTLDVLPVWQNALFECVAGAVLTRFSAIRWRKHLVPGPARRLQFRCHSHSGCCLHCRRQFFKRQHV